MKKTNYIEVFNPIDKKKHLARILKRKLKPEYMVLENKEKFMYINNLNYNILSITPKLLIKCGFESDGFVFRKKNMVIVQIFSICPDKNRTLDNFYGYTFLKNNDETENFIDGYKKNISDEHFDDFIKAYNTTMSIDELRKFLEIRLPNFDKIMIDYYNDNPFDPFI